MARDPVPPIMKSSKFWRESLVWLLVGGLFGFLLAFVATAGVIESMAGAVGGILAGPAGPADGWNRGPRRWSAGSRLTRGRFSRGGHKAACCRPRCGWR